MLELVFFEAEVVAELVQDGQADLLANLLVGFADGLDVLLVEKDLVGRAGLEDALLGAGDADELAEQQLLVGRCPAALAAGAGFADDDEVFGPGAGGGPGGRPP